MALLPTSQSRDDVTHISPGYCFVKNTINLSCFLINCQPLPPASRILPRAPLPGIRHQHENLCLVCFPLISNYQKYNMDKIAASKEFMLVVSGYVSG